MTALSAQQARSFAAGAAAALRRQAELGVEGVDPELARKLVAAFEHLAAGARPDRPAIEPRPVPARRAPESIHGATAGPSAAADTPQRTAPRPSPPRPAGSADSRPAWLPPPRGQALGVGSAALASLRADIGDCRRCKLCDRRTNLVFGVGNPNARLMFVGEAPGADEDLQGEPFVGKAGQLLDRMIAAMGLSRDQVYIANVVKCRPPGNRDPEATEVAECLPFLRAQIAAVAPEVIVALGRIAPSALLGRSVQITRERGTWTSFDSVPMMLTYHPAFLLRDPSHKRDAWSDLQAVMGRLGLSPRP